MKNKKGIVLILVFAVIMSVLSGCGKTSENSENVPKTIVIGTTMQIENAVKGEYNFDMISSGCAQIPVVSLDSENNYYSRLVRWDTEDSKTWVFTVLDDVFWSDGEPVSPEDIALAVESEDSFAGTYEQIICSLNDKTFTIILNEPNVRFLSNMTSVRPLPYHKHVKNEPYDDVWCGGYVFSGFDRDAGTLTFKANESSALVETLIYRIFGNEETMYMALQNGDIDLVWNYSSGVSAAYQDVLKASEGVKLISAAQTNLPCVLCFNNSKGFFSDRNMRLAVSYALDYETLASYLGGEYASVAGRNLVPQPTQGYKACDALKQDIETAGKYMADSGYEKGSDGFYHSPSGNTAEFTLDINSSNQTALSASELLKTQLESFGIKVELNVLDKTAFQAKTTNSKSDGNITTEAAVMSFTSAGMAMKNGLGSIYIDGSHPVQGCCSVSDDAFKSIMSELEGAKTLDEYNDAAAKLQEYYCNECPALALYWDKTVYAVSSSFTTARQMLSSQTETPEFYIDVNFGLNNRNNWRLGIKDSGTDK